MDEGFSCHTGQLGYSCCFAERLSLPYSSVNFSFNVRFLSYFSETSLSFCYSSVNFIEI